MIVALTLMGFLAWAGALVLAMALAMPVFWLWYHSGGGPI